MPEAISPDAGLQKIYVAGAELLRQWVVDFIVHISSAKFECSAPDLNTCTDESLPEFAFIGRSNVGKSSLLNMLSGVPDMARVSVTPGFTKMINFFTMNKCWRLVDLPGYGYAHAAKGTVSRFNQAVSHYLKARTNLCSIFALIDSTLEPQAIDVDFVHWLVRNEVPFVLVFTKIDRSDSPAAVQANIAAFMERIAAWFVQPPAVFTCSSLTGQGRQELLGVVEESMNAIQAEAVAKLAAEGLPAPSRKELAKETKPKRPHPHRPW